MRLVVPCPAKINTFLSVGPRDARGYHPIRTVFQAIGLYDELIITTGGLSRITSNCHEMPASNTVSRALALVAEIAQIPPIDVHVVKRIPAQSGLGGGSSDAAGLLRAIPLLIGAPLHEPELRSVALAVGADVPFFLVGGRAKAEGYGERLTPLPDDPTQWLVLARPQADCPTGAMYARLDEMSYAWKELSDDMETYNDFERVAPCECLDLIERLRVLGARKAGLSGSGSAVFGMCSSRGEAESLERRLRGEFQGQIWVVHTLSRQESLQVKTD